MSVNIRRATRADAGLVLNFIRNLAGYEKLTYEVTATEPDICGSFFGKNPRVFAEIAEWNGEAAGFAVWFYNYSTFHGCHGIYLEDLYVDPEHRGKGLGRAILQHLARTCIAENLTRLQWWVLDWNEPSIAFYKSLGAIPMSEWTVFRVSGEALKRLAR
jgi:GNAT superfamily N-acetyltransferase